MSKIKGRYVATIILEAEKVRDADCFPLEKIRENFEGLSEEIKKELGQGDFSKIEVIPQYCDVYEVEEE